MKTKKELMPHFETEEDEAEYWDSHSPLDIAPVEPQPQELQVRRPKDRPITIRLDSRTRSRLNRIAAKRGLGPSTFARLVLTSAIEQENRSPQHAAADEPGHVLTKTPTKAELQAMQQRIRHLMEETTVGDPDNPSFLVLERPQLGEWGEIGLQLVNFLLSVREGNIHVVTPQNSEYARVKALVESPR